jgi:O-methyltransferase involved in polyketide biosynthesis
MQSAYNQVEQLIIRSMDSVNRTLFIPLYGKAKVSKKNIILSDPYAEKIWEKEAFPVKGKSGSKWLAYNMAMRARIFDEWTESMIEQDSGALVLHIGCGLDSRCQRVKNIPNSGLIVISRMLYRCEEVITKRHPYIKCAN